MVRNNSCWLKWAENKLEPLTKQMPKFILKRQNIEVNALGWKEQYNYKIVKENSDTTLENWELIRYKVLFFKLFNFIN